MRKMMCLAALVLCAPNEARAQRPAQTPQSSVVVGRPAATAAGIPKPVIVWKGLDVNAKGSDGKPYMGITLGVTNYAQYPAALFAPASELPPCGETKSAPRAWVNILDRKTRKVLYTHCAISGASGLRTLTFNLRREEMPSEIVLEIHDRAGRQRYHSNCLNPAGGKPCADVEILVGTAPPPKAVLAGVPLAFHTILGRMPEDAEAAQWEAEKKSKQLGQAQLNQALLEWLTTAPDEAKVEEIRQTIERAYKAANKSASQQDKDYWANRIVARTAYYQTILDALGKQ